MRLAEQVAIVVGASSGIGRATALALAGEGARVLLVARRANELEAVAQTIASQGGEAIPWPGDVADPGVAEQMARAAADRWGRIDILVNSQGYNVPQRHLATISLADWHRTFDVNVHSAFYTVRAVLPYMRAQRRGTIVNISSISGRRAYAVSGVAYCAAKFALTALTQSINLEEWPHGIRACAIFPGQTNTPILDQRPVPPPPEARAEMLQPEDVAAAVLLAVTLPPRASVDEILIRPSRRDDGF